MIGLPVTFASHTAPGCATRAGPLGPSSANATGRRSTSRTSCSSALRATARRRPACRAVAELRDDPRDPFTIEVLARDDDDPTPLEVDRARQNAAVPERMNRMPKRLRGIEMFERRRSGSGRSSRGRQGLGSRVLKWRRAPVACATKLAMQADPCELQVTSYQFKANDGAEQLEPRRRHSVAV